MPVLALAAQTRGTGRIEQAGQQHLIGLDDLQLTDLTTPYEFGWSGQFASQSILIPHEHLGLPTDLIHAAMFRLRSSPLHDLVLHHLRSVASDADRLASDPGLSALLSATIDLTRALLVSAVQDGVHAPAVRHETMASRVMAYVRHHLTDPALTPTRIATAHNISLRQLYKLFESQGLSLQQWIITQRLEGARNELGSPGTRRRTLAAVARSWGFTDPSHFGRRFRRQFGVSPSEWQRLAAADRTMAVSAQGRPADARAGRVRDVHGQPADTMR